MEEKGSNPLRSSREEVFWIWGEGGCAVINKTVSSQASAWLTARTNWVMQARETERDRGSGGKWQKRKERDDLSPNNNNNGSDRMDRWSSQLEATADWAIVSLTPLERRAESVGKGKGGQSKSGRDEGLHN